MVSLSTLTLLARSAAGRLTGIAGDTIAVALATLAEGLSKTGNIEINAIGPTATTVQIRNGTPGQVSGLNVSGNVEALGAVSGTGVFSYNSNVVLQSDGSSHSITLTGTPTGNRTVTFPDADITLGPSNFIGSYAKAYLQANTAFGAGTTAFCTDINGINGGTTGVLCYLGNNPVNGWLRFSNDNAI